MSLGTVWFDESTSDKVAIYVYDASHTRVAKRVLHNPEVDAAAAEELAVVVRAAIDSLLAGEDVAMDVVPMPAPAPIEEPPPAAAAGARPSPLHVRFGVAYAGTSFASGTWQNGGAFFLLVRPLKALYVGAAYTLFPTLTLEAFGAEARIARHPVEMTHWPAARALLACRSRARGVLAARRVQRTTVLQDPRLTACLRDTRLRWGISPRARLWLPVVGPLRAFAMGGADVLFGDFDYVINAPGGRGHHFPTSDPTTRRRWHRGRAPMRLAPLFLLLAACSAAPNDLIADFHETLGSACIEPTGSPDDTVALYEFENDPPGYVIRDTTGHQDGVVLNGSSVFVAGPNGCGRSFEFGTDTRYVTLPDFPGWDLRTGSVDFWFRVPDQVTGSLGILSRDMLGTDTPGHISFWLAPDRTVVARLQAPEGNSTRCSASALAAGAWAKVQSTSAPRAPSST